MQKKYTILVAIVVVAILGIATYTLFTKDNQPNGQTLGDQTSQTPPPSPNPVPQGSPSPTPTPTPPTPPSTETSYTFQTVQSHNSESSCWTVIRGNVYDLTTWIGTHPGGRGAILGLCGKDGTEAFVDQHGGLQQQESVLATFKIGILK